MTIEVNGETLELCPERALHWPARGRLCFSDVHLGKAESLQAEGVALPAESGASDLERLDALIARVNPKEIFILGDFIHHQNSWTPDLLTELNLFFADHRQIRWNLILGNHERGSLAYLQSLPLTLTTGHMALPPFALTHGHGPATSELLPIEGHVHPALTLRKGPLKMRFPCFALEPSRLLLPSFGTWTGGIEIERLKKGRYFAVSSHDVFEIGI